MIVALRFHGTGLPAVTLAPGRRTFTVGAGAADLVVPRILASDVAGVHAIVERTDDAIRVTGTAGGEIYRTERTPAVTELLLHAGQVGWVGSAPVQAIDPKLSMVRPALAWALGLDAHAAVDDALTAVADRAPLLLVGPRGTEAEVLARAIHEATPGSRAFIPTDRPVPLIENATLYVDLDPLRKLTAAHAAGLFHPWRDLRVIFHATLPRHARSLLDSYVDSTRVLALPPLAERRAEIPRLMGTMWRDLGSNRSVDELAPGAIRGLTSYPWPGNLPELRAQARRVLAFHEAGSVRVAAASLGIVHQTLCGHLNRIGVPIFDEEQREMRRDRRARRLRADRDKPPLHAFRALRCLRRAEPLMYVSGERAEMVKVAALHQVVLAIVAALEVVLA